MKILFALAVSNEDSARAEKLLDFIHHYSGKGGQLVLGLLSDLHAEMKSRLRISAGLAFDVVHEFEIRPVSQSGALPSAKTNNAFRQMATHIESTFAWPFLWLESDCTPTATNWRERIAAAYCEQPFPFFGNRMRINPRKEGDIETFFMARVGVYPPNASTKMVLPTDNPIPMEIISGNVTSRRMGITKLLQPLSINTEADLLKVRDDAVLIQGDKGSFLLNQVSDEAPRPERVKVEVIPVKETPVVLPEPITLPEPEPLVSEPEVPAAPVTAPVKTTHSRRRKVV